MAGSPRKPTLFEVATYLFVLAVIVKGLFLYENRHPPRDALVSVMGVVGEVRLGGQGNATILHVATPNGMHPYLSHYGKVWPGMEQIRVGDPVHLLAEREKLNQREFITGQKFYIWELTHAGHRIIEYEDTLSQVREQEAVVNRYINQGVGLGFFIFLVAYVRRRRVAGG
ncbi:MAG: hypothetical protein OEY97_08455 [Nitrospirota bacterium]|nr:hypothetical protein [Nitrospirota bacterium]